MNPSKPYYLAIACATGLGCATAVNDSGGGAFDAAPHDTASSPLDAASDSAGDVSNVVDSRPAGDSDVPKDGGVDGATTDTFGDDAPFADAPTDAPGDSAKVDSTTLDTGAVDTGAKDTFVPPDTTVADTSGDAGTVGRVLIFTDATDTLADDAVTALGGTPVVASTTTFNTLFDAGGFSAVVIDSSQNYLPTGMDTRLVTWVTGGGRLAFAYWYLNGTPTISTALEVSTVSYDSIWRDVYRDTTAAANLFVGKETFPSPLTGTVEGIADNGDALTLTGTGGILAARLDSATGPGAIAITRGGKTIVNGFAPWDAQATDGDADGIKDMRELWENELLYVLAH